MQDAITSITQWFTDDRARLAWSDVQNDRISSYGDLYRDSPIVHGGLLNENVPPGVVPGPQHCIGGVPSQLKPAAWIRELRGEESHDTAEFIFKGIMFGFPIIDGGARIEEYDCYNYKSALTSPAFEMITSLFISEIAENKLIYATTAPKCIHAVGAVPNRMGKSDR